MTGLLVRLRTSSTRATASAGQTPASTTPAATTRTDAPGIPAQRPGAKPVESRKRDRLAAILHPRLGRAAEPAPQEPSGPQLADPMTHLPPEIGGLMMRHLDEKSRGDAMLVNEHWKQLGSVEVQRLHVNSPSELRGFSKAFPDAAKRFSNGGLETLELGAGHYDRADLERLPRPLLESLRTLDLGPDATLSPDACALVAALPSLQSLRLGRGAIPLQKESVDPLNASPGLKKIEAQLRVPEDFDAIAQFTKPLALRIEGRLADARGDTEITDAHLAKIPPSTTSLVASRPLPNVTRAGWAALNELPELSNLQAVTSHPDDIAALSWSTKLTRLDIAASRPGSFDELRDRHLDGLPNSVQELAFHGDQSYLSKAFWTALGARPDLRSVCAIARGRDQLARMVHCDKLKSLALRSDETEFGGPHVEDALIAALPLGLEELEVRDHLVKVRPETWLAMDDRPALRRLDIVGKRSHELRALSASAKATGLDFSQMTDYGDADLARLPPRLRRFSLGAPEGRIQPATLDKLRQEHPDLERFEIRAPLDQVSHAMTQFGPSGLVTALTVRDIPRGAKLRKQDMKGLPSSLRELVLHAYYHDRDVAPDLAQQWAGLPLERLELRGIPLGLKAVKELAKHPTLRSLTARRADLSDEAGLHLARNTTLRHVDLEDNKLETHSLEVLLRINEHLKSVNVRGNRLGNELYRELTANRPMHLDELVF